MVNPRLVITSILNKTLNQDFNKSPDIKCHQHPSAAISFRSNVRLKLQRELKHVADVVCFLSIFDVLCLTV
jgi:hypothetical protein